MLGDLSSKWLVFKRPLLAGFERPLTAVGSGSMAGLRALVAKLVMDASPISADEWPITIASLRVLLALCLPKELKELPDGANAFLQWSDPPKTGVSMPTEADVLPNFYRHHSPIGPIDIELATIHSSKGQTHTATLVLETFDRTHDLKAVLGFLKGGKAGKNPPVKHMKRVFVAMTRPRELLCLAMRRDHVSAKDATDLISRGWSVCDVGQAGVAE